MIERLLTRWPSLPKGIAAPLSLITLLLWVGSMVFVVRKATEQTALALTADLAAYGERARWSGIYYRGEKIGFSVSQMSERPEGGFKLQEDGQMVITLMGDPIASKLKTEVNVDPQYMLQNFAFSLDPGTGPIAIKGVLETPTRLQIDVTSPGGGQRSRTIDLKEPPVLSLNMPKRLLAMGLTEGARHQIQLFDPATLTNGLATITIGKREVVRIQDRPVPAFKMEMSYAGINATSWITEVGDIVKEESTMGMVVIRESRERATALAMSSEIRADMIETAAIQPETKRNIEFAAGLSSLRLEFSGAALPGTPEEMNGAGQTVRGNIVEIVNPNTLKAEPVPGDIQAFLASEPFIESDAPEIVAETAKALERAQNATSRRKAELLVRYVNAVLEKKPTMSIPSAVEVLRTRVGDCNEHTALYVAMARAAKIPSRVAIGLVSMRGAFYYHAWPEVFVGDAKSPADGKTGVWIPVDPTLNQFPADVSHVRMARGGFDRQAAILPLLGRAKIKILDMVDDPSQTNTAVLVGAERPDVPTLAIDLPAPQSKESCWRRPARR